MKYLVLRTFRSYGVTLRKGEVVDESAIRSPRLRRSEGKIFPAVEEPLVDTESENSAVTSSGVTEGQGIAAPDSQSTPSTEELPKASPVKRLSFNQ